MDCKVGKRLTIRVSHIEITCSKKEMDVYISEKLKFLFGCKSLMHEVKFGRSNPKLVCTGYGD